MVAFLIGFSDVPRRDGRSRKERGGSMVGEKAGVGEGRRGRRGVPVAAVRMVEMKECFAPPMYWWQFFRAWLDWASGVFVSAAGCWLMLLLLLYAMRFSGGLQVLLLLSTWC